MEDLYNKASLVLTPQMVEAGKVYSMKPEDRKGDFTFSRSTAATRVNASGNIEKETQNLLNYSNDFSKSAWVNTDVSITSGQSGYDGTSDAWLLTKLTGGSFSRNAQGLSSSGVQVFSVYAKADTLTWIRLLGIGSSNNPYAYYNLNNGTLGAKHSSVIDHNIESIGNGWYRCDMIFNESLSEVRIYPVTADGDFSTSGSIYIQDAQLEQGLVARDVITTTTTAIYGGITDNAPRLDYTDSSCPALLLEPQRTNKIGNSEFINNDSSWYEANGADCTPNYALSPEGVNNATRVQLDNSGAFSLTRIYHDFVPDASNDTASFYAKSNTGSSFDIVIYFRDSGFGAVRGSKTITITNEWQRFDLTADCSGAAGNVMFLIYNTTASENWDFLMYGAQVEQGSYATSYIPTYGSAVTRNGEVCGDAGNASTFNSAEGVLCLEIAALADDLTNRGISITDGTSTNRITFLLSSQSNTLRVFGVSGALQFNLQNSSFNTLNYNKIAVLYQLNNFKFFVNGTQIGSSTSGAVPIGLNSIVFDNGSGGLNFYGKTKQVLYFPTALSDEELAALTTIG